MQAADTFMLHAAVWIVVLPHSLPGQCSCLSLIRRPCWQSGRPGLRSAGRHHPGTSWL